MPLDKTKVAPFAHAFGPGGGSERALIELAHQDAVDCARYRFDHDGKARPRTRAFGTEAAVLVKEQVGSGKSHRARREIAELLCNRPGARIAFLTSTLKLAEQSRVGLEAITDQPWLVYRGFEAKIDGVPICTFFEQAIAARRVGLDPYDVLCPGCPNQRSCPLWAQVNDPNPCVVTTHAMLQHGLKPHDTRAAFDLVVIDEDPTSTLLADETYALSLLINVKCGDKTRATLNQLLKVATAAFDAEGRILIQDLPRAKALRAAADRLRKKPSIKISRDRLPDAEAVAGAETRLKVVALLDDVIDAMAMTPGPRGEVAGCKVLPQKGGTPAFEISVARDTHPQFADAHAVQVLSATAQPLLLQRSIPSLELHATPWQPYEHGKFVFVQGAKVSRNSLLDGDKLAPGGDEVNGNKLAPGGLEALEVVSTLARRHQRVFLTGQKAVIEAMAAAGLPRNVTATNFGAVEGLNDAAQCDAIIILGRLLPDTAKMILQAEAAAGGFIDVDLNWTDKEGESQPTYGRKITRDLTAKDGSPYTAETRRYENEYLHALRQVITHGNATQADRSRGQHRTPDNPVTIYDMTGLDNVWDIDEVMRWRSLCGPFGALEAMGLVPAPEASRGLNVALAAILPRWFKDANAVKNYRVYAKATYGETIESFVADCPFKHRVKVPITVPGGNRVPFIVDAATGPEAADLIRKHLPPGTKIGPYACHKRRRRGAKLNQEETQHDDDCIIYELAAGPRALASPKKSPEPPHGAGSGA